jgi:membrane protease YdiL (CAAX protease family)
MPSLFFVGLILGYMREQSGSVLPGVLLHALQNGIALLAFQAALSAPA